MHARIVSRVWPVVVAALWLPGLAGTAAEAQSRPAVTGRVVNALTLEPVAGAHLRIAEARIEAQTGPDGSFAIEGLAPGRHHAIVTARGFVARHVAIDVPSPGDEEIALAPELHYSEVVSVSPRARDQFESYQPTSVISGQTLAIEGASTLAGTLATQPGIAQRSFGPAPARPVIRGLDGDRVLILEDGQRMGDLSSQSGDHGVNVNPAAATRIEVVRGPATLLYGANAIGGLVNVISDAIPRAPVSGASGTAQLELATNAGEAAAAADLLVGNGAWALRVGGSGRRTGDVDTPEGAIDNTQSRSGLGQVGVSFTGEHGYLGGSYAYDDTRYGVPVIEDGLVELTPRRHSLSLRGERRSLGGLFESVRGTLGYRRYRHDEVVAGEIGTAFRNETTEVDLLANHRQVGRLTGTVGGWAMTRAFEAQGDEALSPPVDQSGVALFVYEELTWPHLTLQFGGRYDRASFEPEGGLRSRDFDNVSGSVGLLWRPSHDTTVAVSLARSARNPALEELYYFGPHPGNFAVEIGNAGLDSEKAVGVDVSFRWRLARMSGEITYFRNDIADYIFRRPMSEEEFEERFAGLVDGVEPHGEEGHHHHDEEFPIVEYVGADSVLQGIEAHADVQITRSLTFEGSVDYVRGRLKATDEPLPRIPPMRAAAGLRYQRNALQVGGQVVATARQDRLYPGETGTAGYGLLKLFASYAFTTGDVLNTITARIDNLTDELYRNHLSLIKDEVPEMGRNVKLTYSVRF